MNPRLLVLVVLVVVLSAGVHPIRVSVVEWLSGSDNAEAAATGLTRTVQAATSTGRHGAYYLPAGYESRTMPLLVFFHGTGGKGSLAILRLQTVAEQKRFIVLAPDSASVTGVWIVGQPPDETTEDRSHVMACVREVQGTAGVHIDPAHVLAAGFSVGGSAAAYFATHEAAFTDLAVLHGHVLPRTLGSRRPRTWLSAGDRDRVRPLEYMKTVAEHFGHEGFREVTLRSFRSDHTLQDDELTALADWWLGH